MFSKDLLLPVHSFAKNSTGRLRVDDEQKDATSGQKLHRRVIQEAESHKKMDEDRTLLGL
jgi:hypothetical protein